MNKLKPLIERPYRPCVGLMVFNYLGDVLKTFTHKSAIETIHEHITHEAKKLLLESKLTNSEIAFELGFDYPNYFAKLFKKQTQLTPKQYRIKQRALNKG